MENPNVQDNHVIYTSFSYCLIGFLFI